MGNPYAPKSQSAEPKEVESPEFETPEEVTEIEEETTNSDEVPEGTAAEVLEWVGEDPERAKKALEVEEQGENRVGLSKKLKDLI